MGKILIEVPIGDEEIQNKDHLHFFSHESGCAMFEGIFRNVKVSYNSYITTHGIHTGSIYLSAQKIQLPGDEDYTIIEGTGYERI